MFLNYECINNRTNSIAYTIDSLKLINNCTLSINYLTTYFYKMNRLEQLKTIPTKAFTRSDKDYLIRLWIINWVWWSNLPKWLRFIMTKLFFYLDFEVHDIEYWKLWLEKDLNKQEVLRKRADFWLLKYSWMWPLKPIEDYTLHKQVFFKNVYWFIVMVVKFLLYLIPMPISILAYVLVRFWWKSAINYSIKNK